MIKNLNIIYLRKQLSDRKFRFVGITNGINRECHVFVLNKSLLDSGDYLL